MSKMYVLMKVEYGDFDMPYQTAVAVSNNKDVLKTAADTMNSQRSKEEVNAELRYEVQRESVRVL